MPDQQPYVQISRDPFARHDVIREKVTTDQGCDWCGENYQGHLFRYGHEPDDNPSRRGFLPGMFCGIDCCRNYNGGSPQA